MCPPSKLSVCQQTPGPEILVSLNFENNNKLLQDTHPANGNPEVNPIGQSQLSHSHVEFYREQL